MTDEYLFHNNIIEFRDDNISNGNITDGQSLYSESSDIIDKNLYSSYGTLVGISDPTRFNYDNVSGKAAINTLIKALQNSSNILEYQNALNVYYGLPIVPQDATVVGLYESYNYIINNIAGSNISLTIKPDSSLHNFIQIGTILRISRTGQEITVTDIIDRAAGIIEVSDVSQLQFGPIPDTLNIKLINKYPIKTINATNILVLCNEDSDKIQHVIDIINDISNEYPEILLYGTRGWTINYDGIYHIISASTSSPSETQLNLYDPMNDLEPKYNDYIPSASTDMNIGFIHLPWPTHKYLLLLLKDGTYYKAYIDSPLDTIYDTGDFLKQYDQICRNVTIMNNTILPKWNEFDGFKKNNSLDTNSSIVESVAVNHYAEFGSYFPSNIVS